MMLKLAIGLIFILMAADVSTARGPSVNDALAQARTDYTAKLMINASGDTISWVNALLESKKQTPVVCLPKRLQFTPDTYVKILS